MKLNRIEFIVTWQCGGRCKHCQIGDEINKRGSHRHVIADAAVRAVERLSSICGITSVMTFGGEPLYYPEVTCAIHKAATKCNIETRQIITNGYFTNNTEKSRAVAENLALSGVNSLLLSVDSFHQEHIPIEPVHRFARDVANAKIPNARLYPAWLVNENHKNPYNDRTKEILKSFSDLTLPIGKGNHVSLGGYATKYLREYFETPALNLSENCASMPYSDSLTEVTSISIVPNGNVMVCGFVIGNIYEEDIIDVISRYDPHDDNRTLAIIQGGVSELLTYAKAQGIEIDTSEYCTMCDLCHAVVKCLSN